MGSNHTPGPWFALENEHYWEIKFGDEGYSIGDACQSKFLTGGDNGEANARLMAAAPDLLDAVKGMVSMYVELVESGDAGFWDAEKVLEVIAAREAISKAEGRT